MLAWPLLLRYSTVLLFVQGYIVRGARACVRAVCTLSRTSGVVAPSRSVPPRQDNRNSTCSLLSNISSVLSNPFHLQRDTYVHYVWYGVYAPPPPPRRPCWIDVPWWPLIFPLVWTENYNISVFRNVIQSQMLLNRKFVKISISCRTQEFYKLRKTEKLRRFVLFKINKKLLKFRKIWVPTRARNEVLNSKT